MAALPTSLMHSLTWRAVACLSLAAGLAVMGTACGSKEASPPATSGTVSGAPSTTEPSTAPTTTATTAPATTTNTATPSAYQPLFPFGSPTEAADWQQGGGATRQPDRLDAGKSALAFARFLGYTDIDRIVSVANDAKGAHVSVGYDTEGAHVGTAAVVHLIRYRSGSNAPWEVVGTDDTDFTVDTPRYGATVWSPFKVGGLITGVDESITVHVQQLHANGNFDEKCCIAAGGTDMRWSASLSFSAPTDPVLIVSAVTGGHIQANERFAVTAVKHA